MVTAQQGLTFQTVEQTLETRQTPYCSLTLKDVIMPA
jgi:hypothetical protein